VPVHPVGGHAICLDAVAVLPEVPRDEFPAQTLAALQYLDSGTRTAERGVVSAGLRFTHEPDTLRFFQARFEPVAPRQPAEQTSPFNVNAAGRTFGPV
jgi:tryptophanase